MLSKKILLLAFLITFCIAQPLTLSYAFTLPAIPSVPKLPTINTATNTNTLHVTTQGTNSSVTVTTTTNQYQSTSNTMQETPHPMIPRSQTTVHITWPTTIKITPFSLTPSPTKMIKNTPTNATPVTPTLTPTPSSLPPTNTPTATPTTTPPTSDDKVTYMMNEINKYRAANGLYPVKTDPYTCGFAKIRAQEIVTDFSHTGFENRYNAGKLPYPSFTMIDENIAMTSDYKQVVPLWINSPGHAENMRRDTPYVCVQFSGNYYSYEGWKP